MSGLIIYLAGAVINLVSAVIIFYIRRRMSVSELLFALFAIISSFAGTVAIILAFILSAFLDFIIEKGDNILWRRKEAEK